MSDQDRHSIRDDRKLPVFIHSEIDDSGLDVYERAVYLTLSRRAGSCGEHWESVANMAARLGIGTTKAREVLRALEAYGLIEREERTGDTSIYTLTDPSAWSLPESRVTPTPRVEGGQRQALRGATPGVAKGTPPKVVPQKAVTPSSSSGYVAAPPSRVEVGERAISASQRRKANSYASSILSQQHQSVRRVLDDLQSIYSWKPAQFTVIAQTVLDWVRDHGEERVREALFATIGTGATINQPITYAKAILTKTAAASPTGNGGVRLPDLDQLFGRSNA